MIRPAETPTGDPQSPIATPSGTFCHHTLRTVDVCPKINLADVVVLQDCGVPSIRSVVGSTVVEGAASGEGQASVEPVLLYQLTGAAFQPLAWETKDTEQSNQRRSAEPKLRSAVFFLPTQPHQMSIMVRPGLMKLRTCCRTCLWASAACLKSFHISSLALSSARRSSLVIRHTALRLEEQQI